VRLRAGTTSGAVVHTARGHRRAMAPPGARVPGGSPSRPAQRSGLAADGVRAVGRDDTVRGIGIRSYLTLHHHTDTLAMRVAFTGSNTYRKPLPANPAQRLIAVLHGCACQQQQKRAVLQQLTASARDNQLLHSYRGLAARWRRCRWCPGWLRHNDQRSACGQEEVLHRHPPSPTRRPRRVVGAIDRVDAAMDLYDRCPCDHSTKER